MHGRQAGLARRLVTCAEAPAAVARAGRRAPRSVTPGTLQT